MKRYSFAGFQVDSSSSAVGYASYLLLLFPLFLQAQMRVVIPDLGKKDMGMPDCEVECIPLETTADCLLTPGTNVYVTESNIVVAEYFGKAYLFDRKDGHFIHEIGRRGQGPGEYMGWWAAAGLDEKEQILYHWEVAHWKGYDVKTGKLKRSLKMPERMAILNPFGYKPGLFLGHTTNVTGKTPTKLAVFDKNGVVSKVYPNYEQKILDFKENESWLCSGLFYNYEGKTYFQEIKTDTVFQVLEDRLNPIFFFQHSPKVLPYVLGETKRYVVFKLEKGKEWHIIFFDKKRAVCYVDFESADVPKEWYEGKTNCNFMNQQGELAFLLNPEEILQYIEKHPENKKGWDLRLLDLQEDDNPVVMILKVKD